MDSGEEENGEGARDGTKDDTKTYQPSSIPDTGGVKIKQEDEDGSIGSSAEREGTSGTDINGVQLPNVVLKEEPSESTLVKEEEDDMKEIKHEGEVKKEPKKHTSLHHLVLGPSLGKAGQASVDQAKVAQIMYDAAKGSKFFDNQQRRDENLTKRIEATLKKKAELEPFGFKRETREADRYLAQLEATRDLSQYIVHVDCDAFYASVEELDNPELKHIPMAVGQGDFGVLTTANYEARKFGVRSGMAEHIAKKLCPQLKMIQPDYRKYMRKSREIRAVLSGYDDQMEATSIDEAFLNITDYCEYTGQDVDSVVEEMRAKVLEKTKISVSAGISPNTLISKICSNKNKPNGQFRVQNTREACMEFIGELPIRKVPGIGQSWERQLTAIGILSVKDIYTHRGMLKPLFVEAFPNFLFEVYLGLGRTHVQPSGEYERKSVGVERTFKAISGHEALKERLKVTAEMLEHDMADAGAMGQRIVLSIKLTDFRHFTRQKVLHKYIHTAEELYHYALPLLRNYEDEFGADMKVRLMGLRVEDIIPVDAPVPTKFDDLGRPSTFVKRGNMEMGRIPRLPESEFADLPPMQVSPRKPKPQTPKKETWPCPICLRRVEADDRIFNEHVDGCLSKDAIKEVVRDSLDGREKPPKCGLDEVIRLRDGAESAASEEASKTSPRKRKLEIPVTEDPSRKKNAIDSFFKRSGMSPQKKR